MPSTALAVGETFERYEIETLIGRGGVGEVYRAVDTRLRRKVALKVLRPDRDVGGREHLVARLFREARSAAGLTHPNVVAIHDIGEAEGIFYIVMELVTGAPLIQYIGDSRVTLARKLAWLDQMAQALAAAHRAGVIHRDVKPANVMITVDDNVKVLDFGLAKPLAKPLAPASFRTAQGHVLGTPRYMAPEQLAGLEVDARSDQYSFGLLAYELLSGTHPGGALMGSILPPPLEEVAKDVTPLLARVVQRMLSISPRLRFDSMADVATAITEAAAGRASIALEALEARDTEVAPETVPTGSGSASSTAPTETSPRMLAAGPHDPGPAAREKTMLLDERPRRVPLLFADGEKTLPAATFAAAIAETPSRPAVESTLVSSDQRTALLPPSSFPTTAPRSPPSASRPSASPPSASTPNARLLTPAMLIAALVVLAVSAFAGAFFGSRALTPHNVANAAGDAEPPPVVTTPPTPLTTTDPPLPHATATTEPLDPRPTMRPRPRPASRTSASAAPLPTPAPTPAPPPPRPRLPGDLMDPFGNAR